MREIIISLAYRSYKFNRDMGMTHEALMSIDGLYVGRGDEFLAQYEIDAGVDINTNV